MDVDEYTRRVRPLPDPSLGEIARCCSVMRIPPRLGDLAPSPSVEGCRWWRDPCPPGDRIPLPRARTSCSARFALASKLASRSKSRAYAEFEMTRSSVPMLSGWI